MPNDKLTRGDVSYLLHVSTNTIEMIQRMEESKDKKELLAITVSLRGFCKKRLYGEANNNAINNSDSHSASGLLIDSVGRSADGIIQDSVSKERNGR